MPSISRRMAKAKDELWQLAVTCQASSLADGWVRHEAAEVFVQRYEVLHDRVTPYFEDVTQFNREVVRALGTFMLRAIEAAYYGTTPYHLRTPIDADGASTEILQDAIATAAAVASRARSSGDSEEHAMTAKMTANVRLGLRMNFSRSAALTLLGTKASALLQLHRS